MALRRIPPARNPREGVLQYRKKERKKELETFDSAEKSFRRRRTPYNFENLKNCENALEEVKENAKAEWTKLVCDKITYASSSKEMWESFNTLTSYQDYNRGGVIPLLDDDGSPVFNREDKCLILENVFFLW